MKRLSRQTEEIENGGGNVDDACDPRYTNWLAYGARRRNDKWDSHILFVDEPEDLLNPLGAKGLGEIGVVGTAAAIANAVFHATGKRVRDLPITLDKLLGV